MQCRNRTAILGRQHQLIRYNDQKCSLEIMCEAVEMNLMKDLSDMNEPCLIVGDMWMGQQERLAGRFRIDEQYNDRRKVHLMTWQVN